MQIRFGKLVLYTYNREEAKLLQDLKTGDHIRIGPTVGDVVFKGFGIIVLRGF